MFEPGDPRRRVCISAWPTEGSYWTLRLPADTNHPTTLSVRVGGRAWYLDFDEDGEFYDRSADGLGVAVLYRLKFREDGGARFDVDDFGF